MVPHLRFRLQLSPCPEQPIAHQMLHCGDAVNVAISNMAVGSEKAF
jgi:hypothetical protein